MHVVAVLTRQGRGSGDSAASGGCRSVEVAVSQRMIGGEVWVVIVDHLDDVVVIRGDSAAAGELRRRWLLMLLLPTGTVQAVWV